jgi:uncharacterized protein (TIGR03663 family)
MFKRLLPLVILLLLRFYDLGIRPPHHDEGVNGWFVDGLFSRGYYQYDPANYHGPLFFYILALFEKVFGRGIVSLRIPTVIFGSLITFTPFLFRKWLGRYGTWIAAIIFTVSPAMIFYSRYAIHETLFALSCILFFYFWLRVRDENFTTKNIWGFGLSIAAMATLKENFVLYGASLVVAETACFVYERKSPFEFNKKFWLGLLASAGIAAALVAIIFSGFFQDANGIPNFFRAFFLWSQTGEKGNGHQKPFEYWIKIMGTLEWYALLGLALVPFAFKKVPREVRLVSVVGAVLWLLYSVVAYKTPWCLLSYYWALIFVAAFWIGQWIEGLKKGTSKGWIFAPLLAGFCFSLYEAYDVAYKTPDQEGHYYVYGQTFHDMMDPLNEIIARGEVNPDLKKNLHIEVISSFTWPLPYVLGEFKGTGYFGEANAPQVLDGDEIIMDKQYEAKFASRIKDPANYTRLEVRSRQWAGPVVFFHKKGT